MHVFVASLVVMRAGAPGAAAVPARPVESLEVQANLRVEGDEAPDKSRKRQVSHPDQSVRTPFVHVLLEGPHLPRAKIEMMYILQHHRTFGYMTARAWFRRRGYV